MEAGKHFDAVRDIPDLSGKVIFITGGTAGLGKETILTLTKHNPSHIYFTGRNTTSASAVIQEVEALETSTKITFLACDLESFASVASAAKTFISASNRLDLLLCNAGVMALPPGLTKDGYELQFGTNHMSHALLIDRLFPTLLATASTSDVRIIITSSDGYRAATSIGFDKLRTPQDSWLLGPLVRYGQSKLANILYAQELARRYPQITSVSIHPGIIRTSLITHSTWMMQRLVDLTVGTRVVPVGEGVKNGLWAATAPREKVVNGAYYKPVGTVGKSTSASKNIKLAGELWDWTRAELAKWKGDSV